VVFGLNGTSDDRFEIDMLKWKYVTLLGRLPTSCSVVQCDGPFHATAHVKLDDGRRSNVWFLVPQCKLCNNHSRNGCRMALRKNAALVSVHDVRQVQDSAARETKSHFKSDSHEED
jgi:hypothetical protein